MKTALHVYIYNDGVTIAKKQFNGTYSKYNLSWWDNFDVFKTEVFASMFPLWDTKMAAPYIFTKNV